MDRFQLNGRSNPRLIAIGDIHGCSKALTALIRQVDPQSADTVVTLGDYIDRGPDSRGVLDLLIELEDRCHLVPLMGNHEEIMLTAKRTRARFEFWMTVGGDAALDSYGPGRSMGLIPSEHWAFFERLRLFHETDGSFFVHANYIPDQHFADQRSDTLLWLDLNDPPGPHQSGKSVVVGHTRQENGRILDLGYLKCIDAGCGHGGLLTALDVTTGQVWQVDEHGRKPCSPEEDSARCNLATVWNPAVS